MLRLLLRLLLLLLLLLVIAAAGPAGADETDTPDSIVEPSNALLGQVDGGLESAAVNETLPHDADHEAHADHEPPPGWVTWLFMGLLAAMIVCLALEEKIHAKKSVIVGTFAGVCVLLETMIGTLLGRKLIPFGEVLLPPPVSHKIALPIYIPAIDWGVVTIILGASLFVEVASKSGVFSWLAIRVTKLSGGDPWRLLVAYGLLTVLFSAVLNNVTAMIIIGSLTGVSLRKLGRGDLLLGFLFTEGLLTNVGGLLTLISSVPNIIVGKAADISFADFFLVAAPYVAIATGATLLMARFVFGVSGLSESEKAEAARQVAAFDENEGIESDGLFWFSVGSLVAFIAAMPGQPLLPFGLDQLDLGFIALFFAMVMLLSVKGEADRFYRAVDWDLLGFFAALFVVINMMEHAYVLEKIGDWLKVVIDLPAGVDSSVLLAASAGASSVTDNIPLAAMLAKILERLGTPTDPTSPLWWCVILGSNLGGNITPIGSASTVVAMTIIHKEKLPLSFGGFVKKAIPFAAMQIALAIGYVLVAIG